MIMVQILLRSVPTLCEAECQVCMLTLLSQLSLGSMIARVSNLMLDWVGLPQSQFVSDKRKFKHNGKSSVYTKTNLSSVKNRTGPL